MVPKNLTQEQRIIYEKCARSRTRESDENFR
jgi:hypothetical protein